MPREIQKMAFAVLIFSEGFALNYMQYMYGWSLGKLSSIIIGSFNINPRAVIICREL